MMSNYKTLEEFMVYAQEVGIGLRDLMSVSMKAKDAERLAKHKIKEAELCVRVTYKPFGVKTDIRTVYLSKQSLIGYGLLNDKPSLYQYLAAQYHIAEDCKSDKDMHKVVSSILSDVMDIKSIYFVIQVRLAFQGIELAFFLDSDTILENKEEEVVENTIISSEMESFSENTDLVDMFLNTKAKSMEDNPFLQKPLTASEFIEGFILNNPDTDSSITDDK